jgi:fumarate reductase (CoM/CoB) subunit B
VLSSPGRPATGGEQLTRVLDGCIKCGACLRTCPVLAQEGPTAFPGPRRLAVEAPRFGAPLDSLRAPLSMCTTCARCSDVCPSHIPLTDAVIQVRGTLAIDRTESFGKILDTLARTHRTVEPSVPVAEVPSKGDLLFFPGCIAHGRVEGSVMASMALLVATGAHPFVPLEWACCGSPLKKIGAIEQASRVQERNLAVMGLSTVVTSCPGCTAQLRSSGMDPWHLIEYLHRVGGIPSSRYRDGPPVRVALHRPCHLVRVVGPHTIDMTIDLLEAVPGVTLIEHQGQDSCCGGGGGVASSRPEVAERMARDRVGEAREAGAEVLLAPCPFCVINLRRAGGLEVQDLAVFLAERLDDGQYK